MGQRRIAPPPREGETLRQYADRLGWGHSPPPPRGTEIVVPAPSPPLRDTRAEGRALGLPEPQIGLDVSPGFAPDERDPLPFWERPAWWPPVHRDPTAAYVKRRYLRGRRTKADADDVS